MTICITRRKSILWHLIPVGINIYYCLYVLCIFQNPTLIGFVSWLTKTMRYKLFKLLCKQYCMPQYERSLSHTPWLKAWKLWINVCVLFCCIFCHLLTALHLHTIPLKHCFLALWLDYLLITSWRVVALLKSFMQLDNFGTNICLFFPLFLWTGYK